MKTNTRGIRIRKDHDDKEFHQWKTFPKVQPPKDVPLMCEIYHLNDTEMKFPIYRVYGLWNGIDLLFPCANIWEHERIGFIKFRPWES